MAKANTALDMINFQCQGKATANMVIQTNIAVDISARIMDTLAMNPEKSPVVEVLYDREALLLH